MIIKTYCCFQTQTFHETLERRKIIAGNYYTQFHRNFSLSRPISTGTFESDPIFKLKYIYINVFMLKPELNLRGPE